MLALFRRFFRWLRPDGMRAPEMPPEFQPLEIEGRWLLIRIPIPPEDVLMEMLYQNRENGKPMGILLNVDFDGDFCERLISAERAETSVQRETERTQQIMADNLYDTGAPKRVIVEHRIVHDVRVSRKCGGCGRPIVDYPCPYCSGTAYPKAPPKTRVTMTPQFQPVTEPKQLPSAETPVRRDKKP